LYFYIHVELNSIYILRQGMRKRNHDCP